MHLVLTDLKVSCIRFDTGSAIGSDTGSAKFFAHEKKSY